MPVTTRPSPLRQGASDTALRRMLVGALMLAPLVFLVGQAILPSLPRDFEGAFAGMIDQRDQLVAARLVTALGAFLFLPAAAPIWWLAGRAARAGAAIRVGVVLFDIGTFMNAVSQVVRGYGEEAATAPGLPAGSGAAVYARLGESAVGLPIAYWSIPVFALGIIVIAVGLLLSRSVPVWIPIVLMVSVVLSLLTAGAGPIVAVGLGAMTIAFVGIAAQVVGRGYTESIAVATELGHSG